MITRKQCNQLYYINNCIFNSKLLQNNYLCMLYYYLFLVSIVYFYCNFYIGSIVLKWTVDNINIRNISQNLSINFEITLNNISAETFLLKNTNSKLWSKIMSTMSNDELEDSNHPMINSKSIYIYI